VARAWLENGDDVYALTRSPSRATQLSELGLHAVVGDVTRGESLAELPASATVLYAVGYDGTAEASMREVYVEGLRNVLAALHDDSPRVIYVSSTSVYGQSDGQCVDERSPCVPVTEGGRICLEAEQLLRSDVLGSHCTILRMAGLYGPGRVPRIAALRAGEPIAAPRLGYMNLIHIDDAAAVVLAAERPTASDLYAVTDGHPVQRGDYYTELARLISAPPPRFVEPPADHPAVQRARSSKQVSNRLMLDELGVELMYPSYREGLAAIVAEEGSSQ